MSTARQASDALRRGVLPGAAAGIVGGLAFGAAMTQLGVLPTIASFVRASSATAGFVVHMGIAAVIGAGFGLLVRRQRIKASETLFWGLAYGAFWWFLGPLTLLPLFLGRTLGWNVEAARDQLPALLGHLVYGAAAGLTLAVVRSSGRADAGRVIRIGALARGVGAGLFSGWLLGLSLDAQDGFTSLRSVLVGASPAAAWVGVLVLGALAGLGYAALHPAPTDPSGPTLVRGLAYGFLWWVVAAVTLVPALEGTGLAWSMGEVRAAFATFPGYLLLLGAGTALCYRWLTRTFQVLFSDDVGAVSGEGPGPRGLRAVARGVLGGFVGGLVFTIVMVRIDFLPNVASLVGSGSRVTGFLVHLAIADLIGASYGLLFRRTSYDAPSALGWGVGYGLFWWLLGPLTLLPLLLGSPPTWSAEAAADAFPALVGHLAYGAGLGLVFYRLEVRYNPWWVTHSRREAERALERREQMLGAAPALWALVALVALIVPLVLGS